MGDQFWQIVSMGIYLVAMVVIGFMAHRRTTDFGDYMLGGRGLGPGFQKGLRPASRVGNSGFADKKKAPEPRLRQGDSGVRRFHAACYNHFLRRNARSSRTPIRAISPMIP